MKSKEEIEQLSKIIVPTPMEGTSYLDVRNGFIRGYTKCQEDMADKKYTFNQITDAMAMAREINGKETYYKYSMEEIINSLNKQD